MCATQKDTAAQTTLKAVSFSESLYQAPWCQPLTTPSHHGLQHCAAASSTTEEVTESFSQETPGTSHAPSIQMGGTEKKHRKDLSVSFIPEKKEQARG